MASQLLQLLRLGASLPFELRRPVSTGAARVRLRQQQAARDENFLLSVRALVYENVDSPYRKLLQWARCEWSDLQTTVRSSGVDAALEKLRDAGVYVTLEEFKRQTPIVRHGLSFAPTESDFDNPRLAGGALGGTTSGSRARPIRVAYTWPFIAEESAHEQLLYETHRLQRAPIALWYPTPPGVAGMHNLLMDLKRGCAPERWFSHVDPAQSTMSFAARLALPAIRFGAKLAALPAPKPQFADLSQADAVLDWLREGCMLRTFASSAVRLAERALERGRDLSGVVIFTGGEPLTEARRATIESTGATVFARYVVTEGGLVGASCNARRSSDDMHVYTDRIAVVPRDHELLLTTLSLHTGKVLLNTSLGDTGVLEEKTCACEFGQLGFTTRLSNVRSQQRLTLEGMTVLAADFDAALAEVSRSLGLRSDVMQYRRESESNGIDRLVIVVDAAAVVETSEIEIVQNVYESLQRRGAALQLAAVLWKQSGTIRVARERIEATTNGKQPLQARQSHALSK